MTFDKNRVFTALNADEVKIGSMGVFADTIAELKRKVEHPMIFKVTEILPENKNCRFITDGMVYSFFYLIEELPKEKYRPYENTDEMIEDFANRATDNSYIPLKMVSPIIWVKRKGENGKHLITDFLTTMVNTSRDIVFLEDLFKDFTYLDGTPCGKKEGE